MGEKKILIVDSDQDTAQAVASKARNFNFKVGVFSQGKDLLPLLKESPPDLIILSAELSDENGFVLCKQIKGNKKLKKIPLLLISSGKDKEAFKKHKKLKDAADGYLLKPLDDDDLIDQIEDLIGLPPPPTSSQEIYDSSEIQGLHDKILKLEKTLAEKDIEISKLQNSVGSGLDQELAEKISEEQRKKEDLILDFERDRKVFHEKSEEMEGQIEQLLGENEEFRKQIENLERRSKLSDQENQKRENDLKERIKELLGQVDDANQGREELDRQIHTLNQSHQEEIQKLKHEAQELDEDKIKMEQRVVKAYKKIKMDQIKEEKIEKALEIALSLLKT